MEGVPCQFLVLVSQALTNPSLLQTMAAGTWPAHTDNLSANPKVHTCMDLWNKPTSPFWIASLNTK
jgi:hypothetical protein